MLQVQYWKGREIAVARERCARKGWLIRGRGDSCPAFREEILPPFHADNTLAETSYAGDMTVGSSASVLHSRCLIAAALVVAAAAALVALVASAAAASAVFAAATVTEADLDVLCLDPGVHPHGVSFFSLLRDPHSLACPLFRFCSRP